MVPERIKVQPSAGLTRAFRALEAATGNIRIGVVGRIGARAHTSNAVPLMRVTVWRGNGFAGFANLQYGHIEGRPTAGKPQLDCTLIIERINEERLSQCSWFVSDQQ